MKHVFLIIDCSGSIVADDTIKVGQVNDLSIDLIRACQSALAQIDIRVICYANGAKLYWQSSSNSSFYEIPESRFGGRSNLSKAYNLIQDSIKKESMKNSDCVLVLVSDGEATDNYKKALNELDPRNEITRIALSIGNSTSATEKHSSGETFFFKNGVKDRDAFIAKIVDCI